MFIFILILFIVCRYAIHDFGSWIGNIWESGGFGSALVQVDEDGILNRDLEYTGAGVRGLF
jgi:hypothetical protein